MEIPLQYDSIDELRTRIAELAPHLLKYDYSEVNGFEDLAFAQGQTSKSLQKTPLTDTMDDFYLTDVISRNSYVMARCSQELNPKKQENFKEFVQTWLSH